MQDHTAEDEIRKRSNRDSKVSGLLDHLGGTGHSKRSPHIPLHRYPLEFGLVLGVRLHAQTGREYELADRRRETGEEGVERLK